MTKINLLPWREELNKKRQQNFAKKLVLSILVGLMIIILLHTYFETVNVYQKNRNQIISQEITIIDKKIIDIKNIEEKTKDLLDKVNFIENKQANRPEVVHLFNEIPKLVPEGVFLTKLTQTDEEVLFEGKSQSNTKISAFMRAIESSTWLKFPKLKVIQLQDRQALKKDDLEQLSDFILSATQKASNHSLDNKGANEAIGH
jgi:type IV pilus assembly protein PilN